LQVESNLKAKCLALSHTFITGRSAATWYFPFPSTLIQDGVIEKARRTIFWEGITSLANNESLTAIRVWIVTIGFSMTIKFMSTGRICRCDGWLWISCSTIVITFITNRSASTVSEIVVVTSLVPQIVHHWVSIIVILANVMFWSMIMAGFAAPPSSAVEGVRIQTCSCAIDPLFRRGAVSVLCGCCVFLAVIWVIAGTLSTINFRLVSTHEVELIINHVEITGMGDNTP